MRRIPLALAAVVGTAVLAVAPASGVSDLTPKRGGTLAYRLIGSEPACLNVLSGLCSGQTAVIDAVLAKPFAVAPDFEYQPQLTTASFTKRRPFTLTYRIRSGARWSDGKPITSTDFVFTLHAIRTYGNQQLRGQHAVIRSIHEVDAKTFKVVLKPRTSVWRELFGNVLPEHALRGLDLSKVWTTTIDNPKTGEPIGSGPFLVDHWDRGSQLVLRRNPRYWGPHISYLDRLVVRFAPTANDPTVALRDGELDIATGVPPDAVPAVRRLPGVRVHSVTSPSFEHLDLRLGSGGNPALGNKLVRRALAYGIDRVALSREIFGAIGEPAPGALDSAVIVRQSPYYEAAWRSYRYRPARARQLLEQAGCRRGDDAIYSCAGRRLSLRFVTTPVVADRPIALPLMQAQLRRAGIEVVPVFAAPGAFFNQILPGGNFDAAFFGWVYAPGESWSFAYGCDGEGNYTGYCQRLVTADLNEAGRILDAQQQARVLNRADGRIAKDVPVLPLYQLVATVAYRTYVHNYVLNLSSLFWNAEDWWLDR